MGTTGTASPIRLQIASTPSSVAPPASARVAAAWITGPSASGSENGTPSSIRSAPASTYASATAIAARASGKPPMRYGISAARRSPRAKAKAREMRSAPPPVWPPTSAPPESPSLRSGIEVTDARHYFRQILVSATAEADQVVAGRSRPGGRRRGDGRVGEEPRDRVSRLEGRQDPLELRQLAERAQRLVVGDRPVDRAPGVAQLSVLRPHPRIVEAGRDGVGFDDLSLVVGEDRGHRAVEHPRATGGQRGPVAPLEALPSRLDADQLDLGVVDERVEDADRVRSAAHARDHAARQRPLRRERLLARLVAA